MKKRLVFVLAGILGSLAATGCVPSVKLQTVETTQTDETDGAGLTLHVITTFAGEDGNAGNFQNAVKAWEEQTGNVVSDASATSDETFKARVISDFQMGAEPDVLFYFTGADANSFIQAGKVVSIEEIQKAYPDYAANMNQELIPASLVDGGSYAVPVNGYWEGLFVNTAVLEAAGLEVPGKDYTWDQFLADCEVIKRAGYIPIAASLGSIPHYWWEYATFNQGDPETHYRVPETVDDVGGQNWIAGLEDVKTLYDRGYFPGNTLSATDDDTFRMFMGDQAAFLLDGSWKVGGIIRACQTDPDDPETLDQERLDQFTVTYVPGKGERNATDLIGGLSMGYYITKKAWDNPKKRDAAVDFVTYMTSDEVVPVFARHTASALLEVSDEDQTQFCSLQLKAMEMVSGVTSFTGAVQDLFRGDCRTPIFHGMSQIVTGRTEIKEAVGKGLEVYHAEH